MLARGLRISWAMPAESWPSEVRRSIRRIHSSERLASVMSLPMSTAPSTVPSRLLSWEELMLSTAFPRSFVRMTSSRPSSSRPSRASWMTAATGASNTSEAGSPTTLSLSRSKNFSFISLMMRIVPSQLTTRTQFGELSTTFSAKLRSLTSCS